MVVENIKVTGTLNVKLIDQVGRLVDERNIKNLVVTSGKNWIVSRMGSSAASVMSHMALGTGAMAPVLENTDLLASLIRVGLQTSTITDNTISYVCTFAPGVNTGAITEAGIFNAASGGTMLNRTTFAVVNKSIADTIIVTWNVTVS